MKKNDLRGHVAIAVRACQAKKAEDISILQLNAHASGFTDYFVICSAANPRQMQAIADEVDEKLSLAGQNPSHMEGYKHGEWILLDYVDFVVHIFSDPARKFYDLERLWKTALRLELADLEKPAPRLPVKKSVVKRTTAKAAAKSPSRSAVKRALKTHRAKRGPARKRS